MTDPIADMLTRIRNAILAKHNKVDVPSSKMKAELARILKDQGYINSYKVTGEGAKRSLRIFLRYGPKGEPVLTKIDRISKPGRRVYKPGSEIRQVLGGMGISVFSTSSGLMTGKEARRKNMGGEHICNVY